MSSDMYYSYVIKSPEELHKELIAQLESEREEQCKALELLKRGLKDIKNSIEGAHLTSKRGIVNDVKVEALVSLSKSFDSPIFNREVSGDFDISDLQVKKGSKIELTEIDLSKMLEDRVREDDLAKDRVLFANGILESLRGASLSQNNQKYLNDFIFYVNELLRNDGIDIVDFKGLLLDRYNLLIEKLERQTLGNEINEPLIKDVEKEFVYQNLMEVFDELGMTVKDEITFEGAKRLVIDDQSIAGVELLMNKERRGFLFETVQSEDSDEIVTHNQRMDLLKKANLMCDKHKEISNKMEERGILLRLRNSCEPELGKIRKRKTKKNKMIKRKSKNRTMEIK